MEQVFWAKNTLIKLTIPIILGMVLANYFYINPHWLIMGGFILSIFFYILFYKRNSLIGEFYFYLKCTLLWAILMTLGFIRYQENLPQFKPSDLAQIHHKNSIKYLQLNERSSNPKTWYATILAYQVNHQEQVFSHPCFISFSDTQYNRLLKPHCIIAVKSSFQCIDNLTTSNSFYTFLKHKNIHFKAVIYPQSLDTIFYPPEKFTWNDFIEQTQAKINNIFQQYIQDKNAVGLAKALLYGYRKDIDKSLINAYSQAGIIHIIAVSGMHVSLVYSIMFFLWNFLARFFKNRFFHYLKLLLFTAGIWFFANLSGFAPSILRATIVFSIVLLGEHRNKNAPSYNNLACAALLILWLQPLHIFDLGFQLSFLAVLGIQIFTPMIVSIFYFKNLILKGIWHSIAICIGAQITTTPLTIFYFNQFPSLFIFTNLVAVFLSSIVLYGEFALVFLSFIPIVANFIGLIIKKLIHLLNSIILNFQKLPYIMIDGIQLSLATVIGLYWTLLILIYIKNMALKKKL